MKERAPPRFFSVKERVAIVWESYQPRAVVRPVARRHGIAVNTIYLWRRIYGVRLMEQPIQDAAGRNTVVAALMTQISVLEELIERHAIEAARLSDRLNRFQSGLGSL